METSKLKRLTAVTQQLGASQLASFAYRLTLIVVVVFGLNSCKHDDLDKFLNPDKISKDVHLAQKIDSIWAASMTDGTVPGMGVVIIKNGRTFFQKNYGYADLNAKKPVTNKTGFAIGSTTKAMTSFAVLSLVDKGLVELDEKVTTYLPEFVMKDIRYKDIQVHQLLSHSSGLKTFTTLTPPDDSPEALEGILQILANEELAFAPGQGFYYSNYGSTLAGLLIQRVTNMSYEVYMDEYLFDQIGMHNTTLEYWQPNALGGTKGYVLDSLNQLVETPPYFNRVYSPAGAATITTPDDIALYLQTIVNGATTPWGEQLLSDSLTTRMLTGSVNANEDDLVQYMGGQGTYGFGWYNINRDGYVTIEHGGNIFSMMSYFIVDPETKSAVAILANREDFTKWKVAAKVAKMVFTAE